MRRLLFLIPLLACLGADAPKAVIDGPTDIPTGGSILLDGRRSSSELPLQWILLPPHDSDVYLSFDKDGRSDVILYVPNPRPGTYHFVLTASALVLDKGVPVSAKVNVDFKEIIVASPAPAPKPDPIPDPKPDPNPPPAPNPPPGPTPTGPLFVNYIVDAANIDAAQAAVRRSNTIRPGLKALSASWLAYESDAAELTRRNLLTWATATRPDSPPGFPCAIIQDEAGKVVKRLNKPLEADILKAVKDLRGAN